jgi:hypothetical protein
MHISIPKEKFILVIVGTVVVSLAVGFFIGRQARGFGNRGNLSYRQGMMVPGGNYPSGNFNNQGGMMRGRFQGIPGQQGGSQNGLVPLGTNSSVAPAQTPAPVETPPSAQ